MRWCIHGERGRPPGHLADASVPRNVKKETTFHPRTPGCLIFSTTDMCSSVNRFLSSFPSHPPVYPPRSIDAYICICTHVLSLFVQHAVVRRPQKRSHAVKKIPLCLYTLCIRCVYNVMFKLYYTIRVLKKKIILEIFFRTALLRV